jgi:effector-binding domain-containing protein
MLKKILLGLLGILVLLIIVGFFLPSQIEVTRSTLVNAPAAYAFEQINNLDNWKNWSYWNTLDSSMTVTYGPKHEGKDAYYSWDSKEMGKGKLLITESVPDQSIKADLDFMEQGIAKSWYTFQPEGNQTKVTMGFSTDFGWNPLMRWVGATIMKSEMNKAFDFSLEKIKTIAESQPTFSIKIEEVELPAIHYIGLSKTISPHDPQLSAVMGKMFEELGGVLQKAKVKGEGYPFCLYPRFTDTSMDMICALPVPANAKIPSKYAIQEVPAVSAVKHEYKGPYSKMQPAHDELNKYIAFKKYEINGPAREVYVTNPMAQPDSSQWITEIYYPVKKLE